MGGMMSKATLHEAKLPHRPPFRFVSRFEAHPDGAAGCAVMITPKMLVQTSVSGSKHGIHLLAAEIAAQLMGAHLQQNIASSNVFYLVAIRDYFCSREMLMELRYIMVTSQKSQGAFHDFTVHCAGAEQKRLATFNATIYITERLSTHRSVISGESTQPQAAVEHYENPKPFGRILAAKTESDSAVMELQCNHTESVYRGHFPDNPITPGILLADAMVQTAHCAITAKSQRVQVERIDHILFQKIVPADSKITCRARLFAQEGNLCCCTVSVHHHANRVARGRVWLCLV